MSITTTNILWCIVLNISGHHSDSKIGGNGIMCSTAGDYLMIIQMCFIRANFPILGNTRLLFYDVHDDCYLILFIQARNGIFMEE